MQRSGKLELTWVGKYEQTIVEPRILIEKPELSYGDSESGNMLIHGDNLIALRALEQDFSGRIKCVYIDPPYNTGSAFEHYDDGLEHSEWLCLMRSRLGILHNLLSDDGSIWISIDDYECHYLKVMCDELFGRMNFVTSVLWQKRTSPDNRLRLGGAHDYILVYVKKKGSDKNFNQLPVNELRSADYKNIDNDPRGPWASVDLTGQTGHATPSQFYAITTPSGKQYAPPDGRCWALSEETFISLVKESRIWFGKKGDSRPRQKRFLNEMAGQNSWSWWTNSEVGHNQEAKKENIEIFGADSVFDTPKPERLIERILALGSNPGDIVLDSFLGSGTTAAVAHKMGRRWIGIELGEHAYTHCKVRLDKVIDGEQGGISKAVDWQGGGGYKFYELAPSLFEKHPVLPVYQINKAYTFDMLCEAICKLEGFTYKPEGEMHGHSSENRFIHITREFLSGDYITKILKEVEDNQSILIYSVKMQSGLRLPDNVEVKRIPKDLLEKCSFESEVR